MERDDLKAGLKKKSLTILTSWRMKLQSPVFMHSLILLMLSRKTLCFCLFLAFNISEIEVDLHCRKTHDVLA